MVRGLLILLAAGAAAACGGREPPPDVEFALTAEPTKPIGSYGELVDVTFTVKSSCAVPVVLERVDEMTGRRHEIAKFRTLVDLPVHRDGAALALDPATPEKTRFFRAEAFLRPGEEFTFTRRIRAIEPGVELMFVAMPVDPDAVRGHWWLPDGATRGKWLRATPITLDDYRPATGAVLIPTDAKLPDARLAAAAATFDVPKAPFDRPPRVKGPWTWSRALGGYVVRRGPGELELFGKGEPTPLPDLPFEFLDDLDDAKDGVKVLDPDRGVETVTAATVGEFLARARRRDLGVRFSENPDTAPYELAP